MSIKSKKKSNSKTILFQKNPIENLIINQVFLDCDIYKNIVRIYHFLNKDHFLHILFMLSFLKSITTPLYSVISNSISPPRFSVCVVCT